jgi:hypothetical protein
MTLFFLVPGLQDITKEVFGGRYNPTHTSTSTTFHPSPYIKSHKNCDNLSKFKDGHFL